MIDAQISYKTQRIVQKSIVMEKLAMFLLEIVVWEALMEILLWVAVRNQTRWQQKITRRFYWNV